MTFQQIKKTRDLLKRIDEVSSFQDMEVFLSEIRGFFGIIFSLNLEIKVKNTEGSYTDLYLERDKAQIRAFLESQLANDNKASSILDILDLIEEGENTTIGRVPIKDYVSKVYHMYYGKIVFDKATEKVATSPQLHGLGQLPLDKSLLLGTVTKLKDYALELCSPRQESNHSVPVFSISNYTSANATASANVDVVVAIQQAKQKTEDAGLSDDQYKDVMSKLSEIEEIAKSNESKGKRWQKAKEILKWIAEQGITVAGIVLPLLAPMIG